MTSPFPVSVSSPGKWGHCSPHPKQKRAITRRVVRRNVDDFLPMTVAAEWALHPQDLAEGLAQLRIKLILESHRWGLNFNWALDPELTLSEPQLSHM